MEVKFVDLFAGLGGIRLGFEQAFNERGIKTECILTSEIKLSAVEALKVNFPHKRLVGDIRDLDTQSIEDFDYLLAGFPCQAFSMAGNRLGFKDTRGTLFFEIERILRDKRPYGFLLENVDGLITHNLKNKSDKVGQTFQIILDKLQDLGYKVSWKVLDSKNFGVAQARKRLYIIGTLDKYMDLDNFATTTSVLKDVLEKGLPTSDSFFTKQLLKFYRPEELYGKSIKDKRGGEDNIHSWDIGLKGDITNEQKELLTMLLKERRKKQYSQEIGIKWMDGIPLNLSQIQTFYNKPNIQQLLENLVSKGYLVKEYPKQEMIITDKDNKTYKKRVQDITKEIGYNIVAGKLSFEFNKILNPKEVVPTLVATDIDRLGVLDNGGIRSLSIREGLRLFGFPETYSLDMFDNKNKSYAYDLLGNTVVVPVIKAIVNRIIDMYK